MKKTKVGKDNKKINLKKSPMFLIALFNFIIIIILLIYIIYLRFIPYTTLNYDGYAVSGKEIVNNLLDTTFEVQENINALKVNDQDMVYENLNTYYVGADKTKNINLDFPIYVNDNLALYNLNQKSSLITSDLEIVEGYKGFTLTSGELYNSNTLERADYNEYILMKNSDNVYMNCKEIKVNTFLNNYKIPMNSIINFTDEFVTYYTLDNDHFVYGKILDIDLNSKIVIDEYGKTYTYKEFLVGLGIIKDDTKKEEIIKEDITEEKEEEIPKENKEEIEEVNEESDNKYKWMKPEVTCTKFKSSTYIASSEITIIDVSKAICKIPTFTFYNGENVAFRLSASSTGIVKASKLVPNTTYRVEGTYQYIDQSGSKIEVIFIKDEFTTLDTSNIAPIALDFKNGQIYSNKIEISDLGVISSLQDEAVEGVSKAKIKLNGKAVSISTIELRKILKGQKINYQSLENLKSNTTQEYEIEFYDSIGNEMKMIDNKGSTNTAKAKPILEIKQKNQNDTKVLLDLDLKNEDNVQIYNYRYEILTSMGELCINNIIKQDQKSLRLDNLDGTSTYTINVYADFDIEDGNGTISNQLIGSERFSTINIDSLGNLKLNLEYKEEDLKSNEVKLSVNLLLKETTDIILAQLLNEFDIEIQTSENSQFVQKLELNDEDLMDLKSGNNIDLNVTNLESNTEYKIVCNATVKLGTRSIKKGVTYTTNSFITNKKQATFSIDNQVVTNNMIDCYLNIDDKDGAIGNKDSRIIVVSLKQLESGKEVYTKRIDLLTDINQSRVNLVITGLEKNIHYILTCTANEYNETNNENLVQNLYKIKTFIEEKESVEFVTEGLNGSIELSGLKKIKKDASKNLINIESSNNWYSKCFDVLDKKYYYSKTYDNITDTTTFKSSQCYVYDLRDYIGQTVTMSFFAKVDDGVIANIQNAKKISTGLLKKDGNSILIDNKDDFQFYSYTFEVGSEGYVGFYLPNEVNGNIYIKNLQIEIGDVSYENGEDYIQIGYKKYEYDLKISFKYSLIEQQTDNKLENYYIKIYNKQNNSGDIFVRNYNVPDDLNIIDKNESYNLIAPSVETEFEVKIIVKLYSKEYILDTVTFKYIPGKVEEISNIQNIDDFLDIQPRGSYYLSSGIDLRYPNNLNDYTFGNSNIPFYGSINFNGKIIKKDTTNNTSYIFYRLGSGSSINNIVIDFQINNQSSITYTPVYDEQDEEITQEKINQRVLEETTNGIYSLFLYNDGYISNILLRLKECTRISRNFVGLIGYSNNGVIDNFIVDLNEVDQSKTTDGIKKKVSLYGNQYISGCCLYSRGTIQNGYVYGDGGIESYGSITNYGTRYFAGLVYKTTGGVIQNIYNSSKITFNYIDIENAYGSNIVYKVSNSTTVRNVYSTKDIATKIKGQELCKCFNTEEQPVENGPNIFYKEGGNVSNSFYFSDTHCSNNIDIQVSKSSLNDSNYQKELLNANGYSRFIDEDGYYARLSMNKCMPAQDLRSIEESTVEKILIDVLSSKEITQDNMNAIQVDIKEVLKNTSASEIDAMKLDIMEKLSAYNLNDKNTHLVEFKIYNPDGMNIDSIDINYVNNTTILAQGYTNQKSIVFAVVSNPTSYMNKYYIQRVVSSDISKETNETLFGVGEPLGEKSVNIKCVKDITTIEEWNDIDEVDLNGVNGLEQNYKLNFEGELDFDGFGDIASIDGIFAGSLDGNNKTLKNIYLTRPLFDTIAGNVSNLNIDIINLNISTQYVATIGKTTVGATVENIHLKDVTINSQYSGNNCCIGGIIGYAENSSLENSSVKGIEVEINNNTINDISVGGIIGKVNYSAGFTLKNCYTQNINMLIQNVVSSNGIGGIVGDSMSKINLTYCYSSGLISSEKQRIGGIYGSIDSNESNVQYCYSIVNINSDASSGTLYIGGIGGYINNIANNIYTIYLGNIYVRKQGMDSVNRIVGSSGNTELNNYAYAGQKINGIKSNTKYGATLVSKEMDSDKKSISGNKIETMNDNFLEYFLGKPFVNDGSGNLYINDDAEMGLPKLRKNSVSYDEMIWQDIVSLSGSLNIISLSTEYEDTSTKEVAIITMQVENESGFEITGFEIENMEFNQIEEQEWSPDTKITNIKFKAIPSLYYDTYKLKKILRKGDSTKGELDIVPIDVATKISKSFYKNISCWNYTTDLNGKWDNGFDTIHIGQNYKIIEDINLSNEENINTGISVGRLEADLKENGEKVKIYGGEGDVRKNITLESTYTGLFKECTISLSNISFENININSRNSYIGIFYRISNAKCNNISFNNISVTGGNYVGMIAQMLSVNINNVSLNNINCKGNSYVAGLCGYAILTGANSNFTAKYITINGSYDCIGGIFGWVKGGSLTNLEAYSTDGTKENYDSTKYLVKGRNYVGGCIGLDYANTENIETTWSKIGGTNTYIGAVVGYTSWIRIKNVTSNNNIIEGYQQVGGAIGRAVYIVNNLVSKNNTVKGSSNYVGGCMGYFYYAYVEGTNPIKSSNNTVTSTSGGYVGGIAGYVYAYYNGDYVKNFISENNTITAKANYVGGCVGQACRANNSNVQYINGMISSSNSITSTGSYVGGCVGYSNMILRKSKTINCINISGVNYIGGIVGQALYNNINNSSTYYSINEAYVKNSPVTGTGTYVGGISGYSLGTVYGCAVDEANINGKLSVGGICGYYAGSDTKSASYIVSQTFDLKNSFCTNSSIKATYELVGGLVGTFKYGNIKYCYVGDTNVISDGDVAGGLVGYLQNENTQSNQYISRIRYNYIANTDGRSMVCANDFVGGTIGRIDRVIQADPSRDTEDSIDSYLEDCYGFNLIVTNVEATMGSIVSMGIGSDSSQNENMYGDCSYLRDDQDGMDVVDYDLISSPSFYTDSDMLNFGDRYDVTKLSETEKKFPTLKNTSNWSTLGVVQNGIKLPERTQSFDEPIASNSYNYSSTSEISVKEQLPDIYTYCVDVDKFNIEFSNLDSNAYITIKTDQEVIVANKLIDEKIYSINYDFNTPMDIVISNGNVWYEKEIKPEDVRNTLDIKEQEYFYLNDNKLYSNMREFDGDFVNIYNGKALTKDGNIYNINDMGFIENINSNIEILNKKIPLVEYTYNNRKIQTFYHCTRIIDEENQSVYKNKQIFMKYNSLYTLDGNMSIKGNTVIIDFYNDKQYETVLGNDGKIYNLFTEIKYPSNFKNQDIVSMTSNLNDNSNIILVSYSTGRVYGFNYITGEEVYDNGLGKVTFMNYLKNSFNLDNLLYDVEDKDYSSQEKLIDKLNEVSIDEAIQEINSTENESTMLDYKDNHQINTIVNNNTYDDKDMTYTISYDPTNKSYVVYSSSELLNTDSEEMKSEDEKIKANAKLENYYGNLSVSKIELKNIGVILFVIAIGSIGIILLIMRRKS